MEQMLSGEIARETRHHSGIKHVRDHGVKFAHGWLVMIGGPEVWEE